MVIVCTLGLLRAGEEEEEEEEEEEDLFRECSRYDKYTYTYIRTHLDVCVIHI